MKVFPVSLSAPSLCFTLYVSGDINTIKLGVSEFSLGGNCFCLSECLYVYTHGVEAGVRIERINYPLYESSYKELEDTMISLGHFLTNKIHAGSFSVVGPKRTVFYSRRKEDIRCRK